MTAFALWLNWREVSRVSSTKWTANASQPTYATHTSKTLIQYGNHEEYIHTMIEQLPQGWRRSSCSCLLSVKAVQVQVNKYRYSCHKVAPGRSILHEIYIIVSYEHVWSDQCHEACQSNQVRSQPLGKPFPSNICSLWQLSTCGSTKRQKHAIKNAQFHTGWCKSSRIVYPAGLYL